MSIDVGCGREGAVSEPDLNLFHGDSFAEKQAGTSMPKIMEADLLEVVLLDHPSEVFCHIIGSEELAGLIDTDVVEVISTVGLLEKSSVHFLLFFFFQQKNLNLRDQRKGSEARFGFEDSSPTGANLPFISASMTLCRMEMVFLVKSIASHFSPRTSLLRKP